MAADPLAPAPASEPPPLEWHEHFPPDCPAPEVPDVDDAVFHLVKGTPADWQSHLERGITDDNPEVTDCQRAALSCFLSLEDIKDFRKGIPRFRGRAIHRGDLEPRHGKVLPTGRAGHHSLWVRREYYQTCSELFVLVPDE